MRQSFQASSVQSLQMASLVAENTGELLVALWAKHGFRSNHRVSNFTFPSWLHGPSWKIRKWKLKMKIKAQTITVQTVFFTHKYGNL